MEQMTLLTELEKWLLTIGYKYPAPNGAKALANFQTAAQGIIFLTFSDFTRLSQASPDSKLLKGGK